MQARTDIELLKKLLSQYNYVMSTAELSAAKLYYADIQKLLEKGLIEKVKRGYYHWVDQVNHS